MADVRTIFKDTAFKHGYSADDFRQLMHRAHLVLRSRRGFCNMYEIPGRNEAGAYLHVVTRRYLSRGRRVVIVFHMGRMHKADRTRFGKAVRP